MRQGYCHEKAHIKLSKHFEMKKGCHEVHASLPEQKVQNWNTETTTSNIIGTI